MRHTWVFAVILILGAVTPAQRSREEGLTRVAREMERFRIEGSSTSSGLAEERKSLHFELSPNEKIRLAKQQLAAVIGPLAGLLDPPSRYGNRYRSELGDATASLIRILPHQDCGRNFTVSVAQAQSCEGLPQIIGNGSYYSFRLRSHYNERLVGGTQMVATADRADMQFVNGELVCVGDSVQGLIAGLPAAEFPGKNSPLVTSLRGFKIHADRQAMIDQSRVIANGVSIGGTIFTDRVKVSLDSLYLLRSVALRSYPAALLMTDSQQALIRRITDIGDLRQDIVVAFKVVGMESDGSIVLLVKELSRKDAPVLKL